MDNVPSIHLITINNKIFLGALILRIVNKTTGHVCIWLGHRVYDFIFLWEFNFCGDNRRIIFFFLIFFDTTEAKIIIIKYKY